MSHEINYPNDAGWEKYQRHLQNQSAMNKENIVQKARQYVKELMSLYPSLSAEITDAALDDFAAGYTEGHRDASAAAWMSVKDRLPETRQRIIFNISGHYGGGIKIGAYVANFENEFVKISHVFLADDKGFYTHEITHWMPLPPKPPTP